jgi:hypothetical protein
MEVSMSIRIILALSFLAFPLMGCQKIDQEGIGPVGKLKREPTSQVDTIPASYGRLVSVLQSPGKDARAILWFERPDSTIVAVWVDYFDGIVDDAIVIGRK